MCACGELDPSYVCVTHRDTRHDPGYLLTDPDPGDPSLPGVLLWLVYQKEEK